MSTAVATPPKPAKPVASSELGVGQWVYVAYWAKFPLPGNQKNGMWEFVAARVISAGRAAVCVEIDNPSILAEEAPMGSAVRFVNPDHVFADRETAVQATQELSPPVG